MLVHTDQKPYQCSQCDQAFRQKQLLKRHINLYHDPNYIAPTPKEKTHVCPSCDRQFRHKGNLIRHMALHDPDSTVREHAMALKLGRKKRIQIVNGQPVEEYIGLEDEEEYDGEESYVDDDESLDHSDINEALLAPKSKKQETIAIGEDGQRYMVVEVINMEEDDENSQLQLHEKDDMEVAEYILESSKLFELTITDMLWQDRKVETFVMWKRFFSSDLDDDVLDPLQHNKDQSEKDMSTCFGFVVIINS